MYITSTNFNGSSILVPRFILLVDLPPPPGSTPIGVDPGGRFNDPVETSACKYFPQDN